MFPAHCETTLNEGHGFSRAINGDAFEGFKPLGYVFLSLKGTSFTPYIQETKRWASVFA
jgi:hypothetical protein